MILASTCMITEGFNLFEFLERKFSQVRPKYQPNPKNRIQHYRRPGRFLMKKLVKRPQNSVYQNLKLFQHRDGPDPNSNIIMIPRKITLSTNNQFLLRLLLNHQGTYLSVLYRNGKEVLVTGSALSLPVNIA